MREVLIEAQYLLERTPKRCALMLILLLVSLFLAGAVFGPGTDGVDRRTVPALDLDRYMGEWYEIARFDHPFERGMTAVRARYTRRPEGIEVVNSGLRAVSGRRKEVRGKARTTSDPGRLRVSFFWFFYSDYDVLELGEEYDWALVGGSSPKRLWILSRTPRLSAPTLDRILRLAARRGYDTEQLIFVEQPAEEHAVR